MRLTAMAEHQVPAERIARKLRRSEGAVRAEAARQHVMLAPPDKQLKLTEKRPYGGVTANSAARSRSRRSIEPAAARNKRIEPPIQTETLF